MGLVEIKTNQKRISKDHLLKGLSHRHVHFGRYSKAVREEGNRGPSRMYGLEVVGTGQK